MRHPCLRWRVGALLRRRSSLLFDVLGEQTPTPETIVRNGFRTAGMDPRKGVPEGARWRVAVGTRHEIHRVRGLLIVPMRTAIWDVRTLNGAGVLDEIGALAQRLADPDQSARSVEAMCQRYPGFDADVPLYRENLRTLAGVLQYATVLIVPNGIRLQAESVVNMGLQPPAWQDDHFRPPTLATAYPLMYVANEAPPVQTDDGPTIATLVEVSQSAIGLTKFVDQQGVLLAPNRIAGKIGQLVDPADTDAAYHVALLEGLRNGPLKLTGARPHEDEARALKQMGFERIPSLYFVSISHQSDA